MTQETTFSRQQLYDRVWKTPMQQLAKEFGVSDVGLAKTCRRHDIPVPPRGYWAKKAHGKRVTVTPLQAVPITETIIITKTEAVSQTREAIAPEALELSSARMYEAQAEHLILVPDALRRRHPLVKRTEAYLRSARVNTRGILDAGYACLDVSVSKPHISRAMRIMQALLAAFETRGYPLNLPPERFDPYAPSPLRQPEVKVLGESIAFGIMERVTQSRNPAARPRKPLESAYLFTPTGALSLRCKTLSDGGRHRWADTSGVRVDDRLNEFVVALVEVAIKQRTQRAYWAEQRRLDEAAAQRRHEEATRIRDLEAETAAWHRSRQLRAYIAAVARSAKKNGPIESGSDLDRWLQWARSHADHVDPLHVDPDAADDETDDDDVWGEDGEEP